MHRECHRPYYLIQFSHLRILPSHAGYEYSGPAAAWAYKSLDFSQSYVPFPPRFIPVAPFPDILSPLLLRKRIFLLGPSHHFFLSGCALSQCTQYATPFGPLSIDINIIEALHSTSRFTKMSRETDENEHSLELHLPYIYKLLSRSFPSPDIFPPLIPILVGATSPSSERTYGRLLAPYLADPTSLFIISSDFCHWGHRFSYTYYLPSSSSAPADGFVLRSSKQKNETLIDPPIYESIARLDKLSMDAIETGSHERFLRNLKDTGNTVCGRHPIGVLLAAIEVLHDEGKLREDQGKLRFVRYERSGNVKSLKDSSVSYASGFAVL